MFLLAKAFKIIIPGPLLLRRHDAARVFASVAQSSATAAPSAIAIL
jgi:hypothetical protein